MKRTKKEKTPSKKKSKLGRPPKTEKQKALEKAISSVHPLRNTTKTKDSSKSKSVSKAKINYDYTPNPEGPVSKYREAYAIQAYRLMLLGAAVKDLADFFQVTSATIFNWVSAKDDFREAFYRGKDEADSIVAERLYMRAIGYSHPEEKVFLHRGEIIKTTVTKHYPPDTSAACFWLKNRRRGLWKDSHEHEVIQKSILQPVELEKIADDQLNEIILMAGGPEFAPVWDEDSDE